jgi:hypothetical protein
MLPHPFPLPALSSLPLYRWFVGLDTRLRCEKGVKFGKKGIRGEAESTLEHWAKYKFEN